MPPSVAVAPQLAASDTRISLADGGDTHVTYEWKQRGGKVWKHGGKWEGVVPQLLAAFKKTAAGPRRMQLESTCARGAARRATASG